MNLWIIFCCIWGKENVERDAVVNRLPIRNDAMTVACHLILNKINLYVTITSLSPCCIVGMHLFQRESLPPSQHTYIHTRRRTHTTSPIKLWDAVLCCGCRRRFVTTATRPVYDQSRCWCCCCCWWWCGRPKEWNRVHRANHNVVVTVLHHLHHWCEERNVVPNQNGPNIEEDPNFDRNVCTCRSCWNTRPTNVTLCYFHEGSCM